MPRTVEGDEVCKEIYDMRDSVFYFMLIWEIYDLR
jgi:hypothetical protein